MGRVLLSIGIILLGSLAFLALLWYQGPWWRNDSSALERYLRVYERLHREILISSSWSRVLVLRLPDAGIGNRLTAMASAFVLGMLTRRAVLVDGGLYRMGKVWEPLHIDWDYDETSIAHRGMADLALLMVGDAEIDSLLCHNLHERWLDHTGPVVLTTGQNFLHHLSSNPHHSHLFQRDGPLSSENLMGVILRRFMQPVPSLMKQVRQIKAQLQGTMVVGIHLRDIYHTTEHKQLQIECAYVLAEHTKNQRYFIASDTLAWRQAATQRLGHAFVAVNPFIDEGRDMGDDPQYRGHRRGIEGAVVDLWVLGTSCHQLVLAAGSTFSYVAQALHGAPAVVVSRQGKCVRPLVVEPVSSVFPDLQSQPCWRHSMWDAAKDQICADPLCPIACGGKYERGLGETSEWLRTVLRQQIEARTPQERQELEELRVSNTIALEKARAFDPTFWKIIVPPKSI